MCVYIYIYIYIYRHTYPHWASVIVYRAPYVQTSVSRTGIGCVISRGAERQRCQVFVWLWSAQSCHVTASGAGWVEDLKQEAWPQHRVALICFLAPHISQVWWQYVLCSNTQQYQPSAVNNCCCYLVCLPSWLLFSTGACGKHSPKEGDFWESEFPELRIGAWRAGFAAGLHGHGLRVKGVCFSTDAVIHVGAHMLPVCTCGQPECYLQMYITY